MTTAYADYNDYLTVYLGTAIASADFARLAKRASSIIDQITFGRAAEVEDEDVLSKLSMATCAIADEIYKLEESGGLVTSERIGNISLNYLTNKSAKALLSEVAKQYLWDTDLMYRGILDDE
jgi:hypothetical protein